MFKIKYSFSSTMLCTFPGGLRVQLPSAQYSYKSITQVSVSSAHETVIILFVFRYKIQKFLSN